MNSAIEVHNSLLKSASEVNHQETRVVPHMEVGQAIRQGDVYLVRIPHKPKDIVPTMDLQLVRGETKGSRHILKQTDGLRVYRLNSPTALEGPIVESTDTIHLTHPEHAHFKLPAGCYATYYQQDWSMEEIRSVRD